MAHYEPSLPHGHANPHADNQPPGDVGTAVRWTTAPVTSHISRMAFRDARTDRLLKFGGPFGPGVSVILLRFKSKTGESREYAYRYDSPQAGAAKFAELAASPHPYGEVFYPSMYHTVPYKGL